MSLPVQVMNQRERDALDRHITGNYGEDQLREDNIMIDNPVALVGVNAFDQIVIMPLPPFTHPMSKEQAIDLAVRLVALADDGSEPTFGKLLREFLST